MILIGSKIYGVEGKEYNVVKLLGRGAFGDVYQAISVEGENVAMKTAAVDGMQNDEFQDLLNEGTLALNINHPNVVRISYFHNGRTYPGLPPYLIMEMANGGSLADFYKKNIQTKKKLSKEEMENIALQVFLGMQAINSKLVHRDFHLGNVLIHDGLLKVSDFGLSKVVDSLTRSQTCKGIQHRNYKAPESWEFKKNTIQMDMYSVGVALFELATNAYPYELKGLRDEFIEVQEAHLYQTPKNPKLFNNEVSDNFSSIISKLLKKRPSDRFLNWDEAIKALQTSSAQTKIDVSSLLTHTRKTEAAIEQRQIAQKVANDRAEQQVKKLEYSITSIKEDFQSYVNAFNSQSHSTQLEFKSTQRGFSISRKGMNTGRALDAEFYIAQKFLKQESDPFGREERSYEKGLTFKGNEVQSWGYISTRGGAEVNLMLTLDSEEDLYGNWSIVVHKTSTYVSHMKRAIEPFALKEWSEFAKQISMINVVSSIDTEVKPYKAQDLMFLFQEIL